VPFDIQSAIISFVQESNLRRVAVGIREIQQHFSGLYPLKKWQISRILHRNGFRSLKVIKRQGKRNRESYDEEVKNFRHQWSREDLSRVFCMDETGVWTDNVQMRSYCRIGQNPEVATTDTPQRHTFVATLCGDGRKLPGYFIPHMRQRTRKKVVVQRAVKGMTIKLMLQYIDDIIRPNCPPGSILMMDQLSSHKNKQVLDRLTELQIHYVFFPAKASADLSPCDNFFFPRFQTKFSETASKDNH